MAEDLSDRVSFSFDGKRARETRQRAGISLKILGKELGISYTYLSHLETGSIIISDIENAPQAKKYETWLKEHDYDAHSAQSS